MVDGLTDISGKKNTAGVFYEINSTFSRVMVALLRVRILLSFSLIFKNIFGVRNIIIAEVMRNEDYYQQFDPVLMENSYLGLWIMAKKIDYQLYVRYCRFILR